MLNNHEVLRDTYLLLQVFQNWTSECKPLISPQQGNNKKWMETNIHTFQWSFLLQFLKYLKVINYHLAAVWTLTNQEKNISQHGLVWGKQIQLV